MGTKAARKASTAVLNEEIHLIHYANRLFWAEENVQSREARVGYYRRQDRLEEIRRELTELTKLRIPAQADHSCVIPIKIPA